MAAPRRPKAGCFGPGGSGGSISLGGHGCGDHAGGGNAEHAPYFMSSRPTLFWYQRATIFTKPAIAMGKIFAELTKKLPCKKRVCLLSLQSCRSCTTPRPCQLENSPPTSCKRSTDHRAQRCPNPHQATPRRGGIRAATRSSTSRTTTSAGSSRCVSQLLHCGQGNLRSVTWRTGRSLQHRSWTVLLVREQRGVWATSGHLRETGANAFVTRGVFGCAALTLGGSCWQHLSTRILFSKPENPKDFLVEELKKVHACQREQIAVRSREREVKRRDFC